MDVASCADRHLGITFGLQAVESLSHVSVLFREAFSHPYITFFHLLVNCFSDMPQVFSEYSVSGSYHREELSNCGTGRLM